MLRQVNEILADHNVDKQMSDSRGEVAYLMADISNVREAEIKSLYESLEMLSCRLYLLPLLNQVLTSRIAKIMTRMLY